MDICWHEWLRTTNPAANNYAFEYDVCHSHTYTCDNYDPYSDFYEELIHF